VRWEAVRPLSIVRFERLFFLSLVIGLGQAALGWEELGARAAARGEAAVGVAVLLALTFFTLGALALLVSRGRVGWAKWLLVALCAIGLPLVWASFATGMIVGSPPLAIAQATLQAGSLLLLFTSEARAWLRAEPG
jgi:hypothetical protein